MATPAPSVDGKLDCVISCELLFLIAAGTILFCCFFFCLWFCGRAILGHHREKAKHARYISELEAENQRLTLEQQTLGAAIDTGGGDGSDDEDDDMEPASGPSTDNQEGRVSTHHSLAIGNT